MTDVTDVLSLEFVTVECWCVYRMSQREHVTRYSSMCKSFKNVPLFFANLRRSVGWWTVLSHGSTSNYRNNTFIVLLLRMLKSVFTEINQFLIIVRPHLLKL